MSEERELEELKTLLDGLKKEQGELPAQLKQAAQRGDVDAAALLLARWKVLPVVILATQGEVSALARVVIGAQRQAEIGQLKLEAREIPEEALRQAWQAAQATLDLASRFNPSDYGPKEQARNAAQQAYDEGAQRVRAISERIKELQDGGGFKDYDGELDTTIRELLGLPSLKRPNLAGYLPQHTGTIR